MENSSRAIFWFLLTVGIVVAVVVYQNPDYRKAVRSWISGEESAQHSVLRSHKKAFDAEGLPVVADPEAN